MAVANCRKNGDMESVGVVFNSCSNSNQLLSLINCPTRTSAFWAWMFIETNMHEASNNFLNINYAMIK